LRIAGGRSPTVILNDPDTEIEAAVVVNGVLGGHVNNITEGFLMPAFVDPVVVDLLLVVLRCSGEAPSGIERDAWDIKRGACDEEFHTNTSHEQLLGQFKFQSITPLGPR
jgi:hypothetical protein